MPCASPAPLRKLLYFAQAVLHDSKKTHGKTHLIRLLKEQKPLRFFTVDKYDMRAFARAAKSYGLLFCPIRDKMDPDHIEIAILQDDASKANRIIENCSWMLWTPGRQNWSMLCSRIWKMQPPTTRTRPPWIFLWARRTPVRPSLSPTAADFCKLAVAARRSASSQG